MYVGHHAASRVHPYLHLQDVTLAAKDAALLEHRVLDHLLRHPLLLT